MDQLRKVRIALFAPLLALVLGAAQQCGSLPHTSGVGISGSGAAVVSVRPSVRGLGLAGNGKWYWISLATASGGSWAGHELGKAIQTVGVPGDPCHRRPPDHRVADWIPGSIKLIGTRVTSIIRNGARTPWVDCQGLRRIIRASSHAHGYSPTPMQVIRCVAVVLAYGYPDRIPGFEIAWKLRNDVVYVSSITGRVQSVVPEYLTKEGWKTCSGV